MAPRLKVFVTSDGLTDYIVAASSRPKALAAWGVRQDLFKEGQAHETEDPALVKAALAQPGEVLRRSAGAQGELARLKPVKPARPAGPSKAELKRIADLEARLAGARGGDRRPAGERAGRRARTAGPPDRGARKGPGQGARGAGGQAQRGATGARVTTSG